jgi:hypothetical protein
MEELLSPGGILPALGLHRAGQALAPRATWCLAATLRLTGILKIPTRNPVCGAFHNPLKRTALTGLR